MKKLLYCAAALAMALFVGSCHKENLEPEGNGLTITYELQLPDVIGTKALGDDITNVDNLYYEVWRTDAEKTTIFSDADHLLYHRDAINAFDDAGKATIELDLINNQNFTILFWADVPNNGIYDCSDLTNVKISQSLKSNMRKYAAFSGIDFININEIKNISGRTVHLKRAIAQLNIGTSPESLSQFEGLDKPISLETSKVTVNGLSTSFNVATQEAGEISTEDYEYAQGTVPNVTFTVDSKEYQYVAMNYVGFAKKTGSTIDVIYEFKTSEGTISNEIPNVPVKANYRTNIIGNLISSQASYNVTLDADWTENTNTGNIEVLNNGIVKNQNGDYEITNEEGFAYAVNNLFEDGGDFYILNSLDMGEYNLGQVTLPNGKVVNLIGQKPVVVRSATTGTGITISGLKHPIISTVEAGAQASFTNINIVGAVNTDGSSELTAALVGENNGNVVISGCDASDNNGNVDLIGDVDNDGIGNVTDASKPEGGLAYLQYVLEHTDMANIVLTSPIVIPADETIELDLKGRVVTQTQAQTGAYSMIVNNGTLTLKNGTLTYCDEAELSSDVNYVSNTIINNGKLTIESGVNVINDSKEAVATYGYPHPIDNNGELVINGGTFTNNANYSSMRIWCTTDDNTSVTINGGEFNGSIDLQNVNGSANKGTLTINDGTFNADTYTNSAVRLLGFGADVDEIHGYIKGGTFNGEIARRNWSGTDFNSEVFEITGGIFSDDPSEFLAEGYAVENNNGIWEVYRPAAKIGDNEDATLYANLTEAVAAAQTGETVTLLDDVTLQEALTLPAGITFNGNGKQINGTISAGGDLTFAGHTKVTTFSAGYYNRTITIGEGACLEVTGSGRATLGYGNTFNITGNIQDAKTADKTNVQPSLIIPGGISITGGNDAAMNVTNAYVKIGSTTSKNSAANGKFSLNFTNAIAEFTNQLTFAEPTSGMKPTFEVTVTNSVLTTGTKFIAAAPGSNIKIDNSVVTLSSYFRNSGVWTLCNKSILTGNTIQFGENGGNDGTTIVDDSEFNITGGSEGHALDGKGTGSIILLNGAKAYIDYLKDMLLDVAGGELISTKQINCVKPIAEGLTKDYSKNIYYVSSAAGLETMNTMFADKSAGKEAVLNLKDDIDFTGKTWTPVDSHADTKFTIKEINGNGHTISNLTINGQAMFTRFAGTGDVVVKNITFDNAKVESTGINVSVLTVQSYQNVLLDNVDVKNSSFKGAYKVAPLIGTVYNESPSAITATLKSCDVESCKVTCTSYDFCTTGMVAFVYEGNNDKIKFENCTVKDVSLFANQNGYSSHAAIYVNDAETDDCINEADGVTVTNVTFTAL